MIIVGAGGHAKELMELFQNKEELYLFDNQNEELPNKLYDKYVILRSKEDVFLKFLVDSKFVLGVGSPKNRSELSKLFQSWGGELTSIISQKATLGMHNVHIGKGVNIMHNVIISNDVSIGEGALINSNVNLHHDVKIGSYSEISPGALVLGESKIGDLCHIGAGSIILPKITIGNNVIVGAGSVVTSNIQDNKTVKGIPAK